MEAKRIQEVAVVIWASLQQQSSQNLVTPVPNADAIDFLRAKLSLSICKDLQSIEEIERYLSREENRIMREWALNKMSAGDLESILAFSSAVD